MDTTEITLMSSETTAYRQKKPSAERSISMLWAKYFSMGIMPRTSNTSSMKIVAEPMQAATHTASMTMAKHSVNSSLESTMDSVERGTISIRYPDRVLSSPE